MNEVYEFLKKCKPFYVATVEGDQPRVRPFGALDLFNGNIYLITARPKNVSNQITANPKVEICGYDGEKWIRIKATLVEETNREAKAHMLEENPNLKKRYTVEDDIGRMLCIKDAVATISSFTEQPREIKF